MNANPPSSEDTATPEARRSAMSLVDRHELGMLSSVMRALKHTKSRASCGQRPPSRSSAATPTATPWPLSALSQSARPLVTGVAVLALTLASAVGPPVASADGRRYWCC
jgi:hypothetical protein